MNVALILAALLLNQEPVDPVTHLISNLKSTSKDRRAMAVYALKTYGEAAIHQLDRSGVAPELFPGYRIHVQDSDLRRKCEEKMLSMDFYDAPVSQIIDFIRN